MPLRHRWDFAGNMVYDIVSSQLGQPAGALAGDSEPGGLARNQQAKGNTRHGAHRCVTFRRKRLSMVSCA
jgi:hypothetical protein